MRSYSGSLETIGERECAGIASTAQRGRDGHVVVPSGIDSDNFELNPVILFSHDVERPVATCTSLTVLSRGTTDEKLACRIRFPEVGTSDASDQCLALIKAGVLRGLSIGFNPVETEPLYPSRPYDGLLIKTCELLEISVCAVPVDAGARITERSLPAEIVNTLPKMTVSQGAIQRSLRAIERARRGPILNPTMHVWAIGEASRARQERFTYEQRQADLAALQAQGRLIDIPEVTTRDPEPYRSSSSSHSFYS
jgi:HK97 family phage prohead protease